MTYWRPDGTVQDAHGVLPGGLAGGGQRYQYRDVREAEAAAAGLTKHLAAEVPAESFRVWWSWANPYADGGPLIIAVAVDPEHPDAARSEQQIHKLPETWQGHDLYFVEWPAQPNIGD
jgi:hypothetical protein